jgi:hypothetical protein
MDESTRPIHSATSFACRPPVVFLALDDTFRFGRVPFDRAEIDLDGDPGGVALYHRPGRWIVATRQE